MRLLFLIFLVFILSGSAVYYYRIATTTTPSHVFQLTETIVRELEGFQQADQVNSSPAVNVPAGRKPRHVLQKAREIFLRLQALRKLKGLQRQADPLLTVRLVTPENVFQLVNQILEGTQSLEPVYRTHSALADVTFQRGKTPTDVYANLAKIGHMLESLGAPPLDQNDVYRIVTTLIDDLETIRLTRKLNCDYPKPATSSNKNASDLYALADELQGRVNTMHERMAGDEVRTDRIPHSRPEVLSHADVLDLLNNILADVGKLKAELDIVRPTILTPKVASRTTAEVHNAVNEALLISQCILG